MSVDVVTITDEVFGVSLTRAGAERAVAEANAVAALRTMPRFQAWEDKWRRGVRVKRGQLRSAESAEKLREYQERARLAHVFDDLLADIANEGEQGAEFVEHDDKRPPPGAVPEGLTPEQEQNLVRQGREVKEMIEHPGWPVVMRRIADRVRACLLALETCPTADREYLQATIANLTRPIRTIFQTAVRVGMCVEARRKDR